MSSAGVWGCGGLWQRWNEPWSLFAREDVRWPATRRCGRRLSQIARAHPECRPMAIGRSSHRPARSQPCPSSHLSPQTARHGRRRSAGRGLVEAVATHCYSPSAGNATILFAKRALRQLLHVRQPSEVTLPGLSCSSLFVQLAVRDGGQRVGRVSLSVSAFYSPYVQIRTAFSRYRAPKDTANSWPWPPRRPDYSSEHRILMSKRSDER